jgi:peptidyl-prolyl cis-trans isomerase C
MLTKLTASAALALALSSPATAQDDMTAETVVATVNGQEITLGNMLMVRATLPEQYQQLPNDVLWDGILDQLIQQEALSQDDAAEETVRVRSALQNERRSLLAAEVVAEIADDAVTDAAIQDAYAAQYAGAEQQGVEYNASHILVEAEDTAQTLVNEARGDAEFAALAREHSTGPSGPNGGELGWFSEGMMVPAFQEAVEQLDVGAISDPVQTQFGWHVIRLNETRDMQAPALDEVRNEIVQGLQEEAVSAYVERLVEGAEVTRTDKADVDPTVLSNMDLLEE